MILLMGIAGSGKGTQGKMLADEHGFNLVSMGDVLRAYMNDEQRTRVQSGHLLQDDETIAIIDEYLSSLPADQEVILDGFPRTLPQAEWLMEQIDAGRWDLRTAFHLVASRDAVRERLMSRGRSDDTVEAIEKRFDWYTESTQPILDWLEKAGVNVVSVNAERSVEDVNQELVSYLDKQV